MRKQPSRGFGHALGALVLQKRRAAGLTQVQLAEDAFGTTTKTRRISELESGSVANPHPKTIDPIIAVLGISPSEIEDCAKEAGSRPDQELDRAYREARNLIDAIAKKFEHSEPSASLAELDEFLRAKAQEWSSLRDRIESIDAEELALEDMKSAAAEALADGKFEEVDRLLAQAEHEFQSHRTLVEVRKLAAVRITRGDSQLLKGDPTAALDLYRSAVEFFRPFDEIEMARAINEVAHYAYEVSLRSMMPGFFVAGVLLEILIELPNVKNDKMTMAEALYRLGLAYRNEYDNPRSNRKKEALDKAISFSSIAVNTLENYDRNYQLAASKIGLANCLRDRAKANYSVADLKQAITLLQSAKEQLDEDPESRSLLPYACNSLGSALNVVDIIDCGDEIPNAPDLAYDAFLDAVSASEELHDTEVWGVAKHNIGSALAERAQNKDLDKKHRQFLRIRAISEMHAANEIFPAITSPYKFADLQENLGRIFFEHASSLDHTQLTEVYLFRSIQSYESAASILTQDLNPDRWARLQAYLGRVLAYHATMADTKIAINDCEMAIEHYENALPIFERQGQGSMLHACQTALAQTRAYREDLLSSL